MPGVFGDSGLEEDQEGASSLATAASSISGDTSSQTNLSDIGIDTASESEAPSLKSTLSDPSLLQGESGYADSLPDDSDVILNDTTDEYSNIEIGNVADDSIPAVDIERDLVQDLEQLTVDCRADDHERLSDINR